LEVVMEEAVSAAEANRRFSQLLRGVREGHNYIVTSHGRPVARLVPIEGEDEIAAGALTILLTRLRAQPIRDIGRWTREELYEEGR
jgi:prevent-host-death family protein